jgi:hypothetical protein
MKDRVRRAFKWFLVAISIVALVVAWRATFSRASWNVRGLGRQMAEAASRPRDNVVDLRDVCSFEWDACCICGMYGSDERLSDAIGARWRRPPGWSILDAEDYSLVIFVKNDVVVGWAAIEASLVNLRHAQAMGLVDRKRAVLRVQAGGDEFGVPLLVWER